MSRRTRALAAPILIGAARVALGGLWLNEGLLKYRAGFGAADIRLVASSAAGNSRVPGLYQWFASTVLGGSADVLGVIMPLLETGLGIALILGVLSIPAAMMSTLTLMMYWLADQLIGQYPIMVLLSVVVIVFPIAASRLSVTSLIDIGRHRRNSMAVPIPVGLRRWL